MRRKPNYRRSFPAVVKTYERSSGTTTISAGCIALYKAAACEWGWDNVCSLYSVAVGEILVTVGAEQAPCDLAIFTEDSDENSYVPNPKWSLKETNPITDREIGFQQHKYANQFLTRLCQIQNWSKSGFYRWALERWILHNVQSDIRRCMIQDYVNFTQKWRYAA